MTLGLLLPVALFVGVLIGCIGIGGVLLAPSLVYLGGVDMHVAIASCMFSYLFSGLVGAVEFARRRSIEWSMAGWLFGGAIPGAYLGALGLSFTPAVVLEALIVFLLLFVGTHTLWRTSENGTPSRELSGFQLLLIGFVTGVGSSLSGTGGPLVLVPILIALHVPVLAAVGLSQAVQLPVAALSSAGNYVHGSIDFVIATTMAIALMLGVAVGARLAHSVSAHVLQRIVAVALLLVGAMLLVRLVTQAVAGG